MTTNLNRYTVSTKFTLVKIIVFVCLFSIVFHLTSQALYGKLSSESIFGSAVATIVLTGVLFFVSTRKRIDYDDIHQILYVVDAKKHTEIEIPAERIDRILYSVIGPGGKSYVIVYRDFHDQRQKVRLFPILFDHTIDTIIADAKLKNPNLVTRNWSIGWNELFD